MTELSDTDDNESQKDRTDLIRENVDTTNLNAIMGRFYQAVSWD